jgi:hypothetical protein
MHQRSPRLSWVAVAQFGAACALCLGLLTSTQAEPLVLNDGSAEAGAGTYAVEPVILDYEGASVDDAPVWPAAPGATLTQPASAETAERTSPLPPADPRMPERAGAAPIALGKTQANADASIHSAIKESVRPVYDQLVESGAVGALQDLKADLGLNKNQWDDQQKTNARAEGPRRWDAPSGQGPAQPPRTAAQVQSDREMAGVMREKLIEQITPWLIGAVALYAVAYLARLLHRHMRWRSAKRNQRRSARSQRHASRRSRSSSNAATHTPSAPPIAVEPQETL